MLTIFTWPVGKGAREQRRTHRTVDAAAAKHENVLIFDEGSDRFERLFGSAAHRERGATLGRF